MKLNLDDLMGIVQQVKPEHRHKTNVKFTGEHYIVTSERKNDYFKLSSRNIRSTKIIYGDDNESLLEIELG
tara:strand:- start:505 stop:717 length:213 start_codon:yes stop_codon:yes gene_type:complete